MNISPSLLAELQNILEEEYKICASDGEAEQIAMNILNFYREAERFTNENSC